MVVARARLGVIASVGAVLVAGLSVPPAASAAASDPERSLELRLALAQLEESGATDLPVLVETTENSRTWEYPNGQVRAEVEPTAVRFADEQGKWHPIDNRLVESGASGVAVENASNDLQLEMPADASERGVRLTSDERWMSFRMEGLDGAPQVEGLTARYPDAEGVAGGAGVESVVYESNTEGVKEVIRLAEAPTLAPVYGFRLKMSAGLRPVLAPGNEVLLQDEDGDVAFTIPAPLMQDSAGPDPAVSSNIAYNLSSLSDGSWRFTVAPSQAWLADPERVYPVMVDPSVTTSTTNSDKIIKECWISQQPTNSDSKMCQSQPLVLKAGVDSGWARRALVHFSPLPTIPNGATVTDAALSLQGTPASTGGSDGIASYRTRRMSNGWSINATWIHRIADDGNANTDETWATPGGDAAGAAPAPNVSVSASASGRQELSALQPVQEWYDTPAASNLGLLIKQTAEDDEGHLMSFYSTQYDDTNGLLGTPNAKGPKLIIKYNSRPSLDASTVTITPQRTSTSPSVKAVDSLTPTLRATATDNGDVGSVLTYVFEVQKSDGTPVITSPESGTQVTAPAGQEATWTLPSALPDEHAQYRFRVKSVTDDGGQQPISAEVPSPWVSFVADRRPAAPSSLAVTPSRGTSPVTTSVLDPEFSAVVSDPDPGESLTTWFEVRKVNTTTLVASGSDDLTSVQNSGRAVFALDRDEALTPGQSYEFRVGVDDAYSVFTGPEQPTALTRWSHTGSTWQQFTVASDANLWQPLQLEEPAAVWDRGAALSWSPYRNDTGASGSELVGYQVFRGCISTTGCPATPGQLTTFTTVRTATDPLNGATVADLLDPTRTTFRDTTANPSLKYRYWVAAVLQSEVDAAPTSGVVKGNTPTNARDVDTPARGRVVRTFIGDAVTDATIASGQPTQSFSRMLELDTTDPTTGRQRGLLGFDTSVIRPGMRVTKATVKVRQSAGTGGAIELRKLNTGFSDDATWNGPTSGSAWTAGGDTAASAVSTVTAAAGAADVVFADSAGMRSLVQGWADDRSTNRGIALQFATDTTTTPRRSADLVPAESIQMDSLLQLRAPRLTVEYLYTSVLDTISAPEMPRAFAPEVEVSVPVRVTNTTDTAFAAGLKLSYRWYNGSTNATPANPDAPYLTGTSTGALQPGESVLINLNVKAPSVAATSSNPSEFDLQLNLFQGSSTGAYYNVVNPYYSSATLQTIAQGLVDDGACGLLPDMLKCSQRRVDAPSSSGVGLEKQYAYDGVETGAGSQALVNLATGNLVWNYDAWSNPSVGPSFFARVTYNSKDSTALVEDPLHPGLPLNPSGGLGWSVQAGTLNKLNVPLLIAPTGDITLTDGDGTTHVWTPKGLPAGGVQQYRNPAGVHLQLEHVLPSLTNPTGTGEFVFTRPDGTKFHFSDVTTLTHPLLPSKVVDLSGNTLTYGYTNGRLSAVTDSVGRIVAELAYDASTLRVTRICGVTNTDKVTGPERRALGFAYKSNNPFLVDHIYDGKLTGTTCTPTASFDSEKKDFQFDYIASTLGDRTNLGRVTDPKGAHTDFGYYDLSSPTLSSYPTWAAQDVPGPVEGRVRSWSDRLGRATYVEYYGSGDPTQADPINRVLRFPSGTAWLTRVLRQGAPKENITETSIDSYDRTLQVRDPEATTSGAPDPTAVTKLTWDADHNVIKLQDPSGATSRWAYDPASGYPTRQWDAEALATNSDGGDGDPTVLRYHQITTTALAASGSDLAVPSTKLWFLDSITTPLGNKTTFTPEPGRGRLGQVTDPTGGTIGYDYNRNGTLQSATDQRGYVTSYDYPTPADDVTNVGLPTTITPPQTRKAPGDAVADVPTVYEIDELGQITKSSRSYTEPYAAETRLVTTADYDIFGRPLIVTTPGAQGPDRTTTTIYDANDNPTQVTAPNGAETRFEYAADDQVITQTLPANTDSSTGSTRTVSYVYDGIGRLCRQIAPLGDHSASKLTCPTAAGSVPDTYATDYFYDQFQTNTNAPRGRIVSTTVRDESTGSARALTSSQIYNTSGDVIRQLDPRSNLTSDVTDKAVDIVYDLDHRPVRQIDAKGYSTRTVYDADGQVIRTTDQLGTPTTMKYDAAGRMIASSIRHGAPGRDPETWTTRFGYDKAGNRISVTRPVTDARPTPYVARTAYDENNRPIVTQKAYDPSSLSAPYGKPATTYMTYDPFGRLAKQSTAAYVNPLPAGEPASIAAPGGATEWTTYTYYDSGDIASSTDPTGIITKYKYTMTGQQSERTLIGADPISGLSQPSKKRSMSWSYYLDDSLRSRTDTASEALSGQADGGVAGNGWTTVEPVKGADQVGDDYAVHAPNPSAESETYTWTLPSPGAGKYRLEFSCPAPGKDADGQLLETTGRTDAAAYTLSGMTSAGTTTPVASQKYCGDGPWRKLTDVTLTATGSLTVAVKGSTTAGVVADSVRLVKVNDNGQTATDNDHTYTYTYDANGQPTATLDSSEVAPIRAYRTTYDVMGRATAVKEFATPDVPDANTVAKRTTAYTYDANSNTTAIVSRRPSDAVDSPDNKRVTKYTYDVRNQVSQIQVGYQLGAVTGQAPDVVAGSMRAWDYTWDPRGLLTTLQKPIAGNSKRNTVKYTYFTSGLMRSKVETQPDASSPNGVMTTASHTLAYNPDGDALSDIAKVQNPGSTGGTGLRRQTTRYAYTPAQLLAAADRSGAKAGADETFTYTATGNIGTQKKTVGKTVTDLTHTYLHDRLDTMQAVQSAPQAPTVTANYGYDYDVFGRLKNVNSPDAPEQSATYTYDGFDRIISETHGPTLTKTTAYDALDRPRLERLNRGGSTRDTVLTYLGTTKQVASERQLQPDGTTRKVTRLYAYDAGGKPIMMVKNPDQTPTTTENGDVRFYSTNARGDVEALTSATDGKASATYRYLSYGEADKNGTLGEDADTVGDMPATGLPTQAVNPYRYNAKRMDPATGNIDMGFRTYSPITNQFLTRDMYNGALSDMRLGTDPWNANRYAFVGGNPITHVELDGHRFVSGDDGDAGQTYNPYTGEFRNEDVERDNRNAIGEAKHEYNDAPYTSTIEGGGDTRSVRERAWDGLGNGFGDGLDFLRDVSGGITEVSATVLTPIDLVTPGTPIQSSKNWLFKNAGVNRDSGRFTWTNRGYGAASTVVGVGAVVKGGRSAINAFSAWRARRAAKSADEFVDLASTARRNHILYGDATGGGHLWPGLPGKTPFPKDWSADRVMHEISDVATDPSSIFRTGRGGSTIVTGTRDGVDVRVILRDGNIITGYPTNLMRNP